MDFAERIQDLRRTGAIETEHTRKLIESLDTVDDIELTALRLPKRSLIAKGAYGPPPGYGSNEEAKDAPPPAYPSSDGTEAPKASPTPSPVLAPSTIIAVPFVLTFQADYNTISSQMASFVADVQSSIASLLGLKPSQVNVTSVLPGSVVVNVALLVDSQTLSTIQSSVATLPTKAQALTPTFAKYGVTSVSATLPGSSTPVVVANPSPATSTPTPVSTPSPTLKAPAAQPQAASSASAALVTMALSCLGAFLIAGLALL